MSFSLATFNVDRWLDDFLAAVAAGCVEWRHAYLALRLARTTHTVRPDHDLPVIWESNDALTTPPHYSLSTAQRHRHQLVQNGFVLEIPRDGGPGHIKVLKHPTDSQATAIRIAVDSLLTHLERNEVEQELDWIASSLCNAFDELRT